MKMNFVSQFDSKRGKGYEVEVDKIRSDVGYSGGFAVRVVGEWKTPRWLSINWFVRPANQGAN